MKWGSMTGFRTFLGDRSGNVIIPGAIALLGFLGLVGSGLDMARIEMQRADLQSVVDAAALTAVKEMAFSTGNAERIRFVASAQVQLRAEGRTITSKPVVDLAAQTLTVTANMPVKAVFPGPFSSVKQVSATATAQFSGSAGNICMIGLDPTARSTLKMSSNARITAENCAIYSNSTSTSSVDVTVSAQVKADLVCSSGGFRGNKELVDAEVVTDCPQIEDPLTGREKPFENTFAIADNRSYFSNLIIQYRLGRDDDDDDDDDDDEGNSQYTNDGCDFRNASVRFGQTVTFTPGVYCGGLTVTGGTANLEPGVYTMRDGSLTVWFGGTLTGENVGFFMSGALATISFTGSSNIELTAPKDGVMTGMLFFEDPDSPVATYHTISSNNARRLVGTVYIPRSKLVISGSDPIADQSEYTIIVAREFELREGPNLVLRTDYHLSDIPVPTGVGPMDDVDAKLLN